jgi:LysR family hydrogen peroxide-inducible transcriptional activator
MNLRDLQYLVALAEHRHFGRAAAASFVSQPTLSTQIRKLEDELGVILIERGPRRVMFTRAGELVVAHARRILGEVHAMREQARRLSDPEAGTLRLGIFPTLGPYLLPHVIPELHRRFPRLELLLVEEKTHEVVAQLLDGRLDAGLLAMPIDHDRLHEEYLFTEPFLLAAPEHHPLAERSALRVNELEGESLLLLEDGHCLRDQALEVCASAGASERAGFRATSLETLRQMVAADVGITLLPALAALPPAPPTPGVRLIPFAAPPPARRIALVWRRTSPIGEFLGRIAAVLRALARDLLDAANAKPPTVLPESPP